ncbi:MAG: ADP-dependent glucokinase/phosphofructokinase, partial [Caldilineaceae bacterium]
MKQQIALGMGNNVDYEIVWDSTVLEALVARYAIGAEELASERPIVSERDLVISILRFVQAGVGGERTLVNSAIIEPFAAHFANRITLGGTSVRSAIAMRKLGYTAALHLVTMNEHVRRLLPPDADWVCSNPTESLFPHLIVQFPAGARIRSGEI